MPEMISGVRASSMRMLSTSSTIAKKCPRWTRSRRSIDQVVAQVVEPELVVGAVGDVGRVGLRSRDGAQVAQALVGGRIRRIEHVGGVVLDAAHAHPQPMEDGADPLRVPLGQVIVHGHHVHPAAGDAVEVGGQRRHERLALAGLHLRDLSAVEDHAADELHVVVALAESAAHGLADRGEGLGQDLVERLVDLLELALALLLAALGDPAGSAAVSSESSSQLSRRRGRPSPSSRRCRGAQLHRAPADRPGAPRDAPGTRTVLATQRLVGEGAVLVVERVDLGQDRLQPADLALVRVHQPGEELQHRDRRVYVSRGRGGPVASVAGLVSAAQRAALGLEPASPRRRSAERGIVRSRRPRRGASQKVISSTSCTSELKRAPDALAAVDPPDRLAEERRHREDGDPASGPRPEAAGWCR